MINLAQQDRTQVEEETKKTEEYVRSLAAEILTDKINHRVYSMIGDLGGGDWHGHVVILLRLFDDDHSTAFDVAGLNATSDRAGLVKYHIERMVTKLALSVFIKGHGE
jgi:hypothetical protein